MQQHQQLHLPAWVVHHHPTHIANARQIDAQSAKHSKAKPHIRAHELTPLPQQKNPAALIPTLLQVTLPLCPP
jgi:hypothetical protein